MVNTLTHLWRPINGTLANSVDPDQQNAASDQDLHCLHKLQAFQYNMVIIKTDQTPLKLEIDWSKEFR